MTIPTATPSDHLTQGPWPVAPCPYWNILPGTRAGMDGATLPGNLSLPEGTGVAGETIDRIPSGNRPMAKDPPQERAPECALSLVAALVSAVTDQAENKSSAAR